MAFCPTALDTSRIDPLIMKENYLMGLVFPRAGVVPLRITAVEKILYRYTALGTMTSGQWLSAQKLSLSTPSSVTNIFEVKEEDEMLHIFYGISPSALRVYPYYPLDVLRRRLPRVDRADKSDMGFVDGFESPMLTPSPLTEMPVIEDVDVGFAFWNPLDSDITPMLNFLASRYRFDVVKDVDLISNILAGRKECRLVTLGGLEGFKYDTSDTFGISPIPLGATRVQIEDALRG